ncbi:SpoIIE family protein phosphatase [Streptomyces nodosus]
MCAWLGGGDVTVEKAAMEEPWVADRIRLLDRAGQGLRGAEALRLALEQAVAGLGGLGGMVHRSAGGADPGLRLVETVGLPQDVLDVWRDIRPDADAPPARALRHGAPVWLPVSPQGPGGLPDRIGVAAVPFPTSGRTPGVLSVLTAGPRPPTPGQWALLEAVARWAAARSPDSRPGPEGEPQPIRSPVQQARDAVKVGAWWWDLRTGKVVFDEAMEDIVGLAPGVFDERVETWRALVHPEDLPGVVAQIDEGLRERAERGIKYRVIRPDGTVRWVESRMCPLPRGDGEPDRVVGRLWETSESHAGLESVGHALRHMTDGFFAVGPDWRVLYVNERAEQVLGAAEDTVGHVLWDLPAARLPGLEENCRRAAADRTPVDLEVQLPSGGRWYHVRLIPVPDVLTFYFTDVTDERRQQEEYEVAERRATERALLIGRLTEALAEALTVEDVVSAAADRVLPLFGASGLALHALDGDRIRAVRAIGYPDRFFELLAGRDILKDHPLLDALRDGTPRFVTSPEHFRKEYPLSADFSLKGGKKAWAFLPLLVSGRPVGACVVSFDQPRRLTGEERTLIIALSGMIAQALARARLYDAEHGRAQQLQRGLLPRALPSLPAVATAARYLPAGAGTLGGDWYDVIPLSADRVALVIGDVMGHGLPEAAAMGRLRTAVHTLAGLELAPDELFTHLDDVVGDLGDDFYATCLYALYDPVSGLCTLACAGHPPPVVVRPDGSVHLLDTAVNPPLGAAAPPFETTEMRLPEGSLLVMYTDGLVESAERDIDRGIAELSGLLARDPAAAPSASTAAGGKDEADHLEALCDSLVSTLLPHQEHISDDAALLVTRLHALPQEDVAVWTLPEGPLAAGRAREHVRARLADWHLDELVTTTELIASELVGNVVRHAKGPVQIRLLRSRTLTCEVSDGSLTTPRIRRAGETDEGGRGLQLVAALSQRWGTRQIPNGKCIWTEQTLPEHPADGPTGAG